MYGGEGKIKFFNQKINRNNLIAATRYKIFQTGINTSYELFQLAKQQDPFLLISIDPHILIEIKSYDFFTKDFEAKLLFDRFNLGTYSSLGIWAIEEKVIPQLIVSVINDWSSKFKLSKDLDSEIKSSTKKLQKLKQEYLKDKAKEYYGDY